VACRPSNVLFVDHATQVVELLHLAQTFVREENKIVILAEHHEEEGSSKKDLEDVELQVAELKVPVLRRVELRLLLLNHRLDFSNNESLLARENVHAFHDVTLIMLNFRLDLL